MKGIQPLPPEEAEKRIGITTTVPSEIIYATGCAPVDLNNVFIASGRAGELVAEAERRGFPRNSCAWIKGVYATARALRLTRVVAVVQGDCANTHAMAEILLDDGVEVIPFAFSYQPDDTALLDVALERFAEALGTTLAEAENWKGRLDALRQLAHRIDALAWEENRVTGEEQHFWTISCSDFFSDPRKYEADAARFIREAEQREPLPDCTRLALVGVPPICDGLFPFLERRAVRVVFNEVPRQFAMPFKTGTLREQYGRYTYPYSIFFRLADIREQIALRNVQGVIHYVQSFCHHQVQDAIVRSELNLPILTLEGDRPGPLDMPTETRIEAFLEMLRSSA